jgi:hypothetical protein
MQKLILYVGIFTVLAYKKIQKTETNCIKIDTNESYNLKLVAHYR